MASELPRLLGSHSPARVLGLVVEEKGTGCSTSSQSTVSDGTNTDAHHSLRFEPIFAILGPT